MTLINYGSSSAITSGSNTLALTRSGTNVRICQRRFHNQCSQSGRQGWRLRLFISQITQISASMTLCLSHTIAHYQHKPTILKGANAVPMHGSVVENGTKWENR